MNTVSAYLGLSAAIAVIIWIVILIALHFIKPNLKPATTLLSEYAIKPKGWIMQTAFVFMAIACFAFVFASWSYIPQWGLVLLGIIGIGFVGAGLFVTDPAFIGEGGQTKNGKLHVLFAFLIIFLFPIMTTIVDIALSSSFIWASLHPYLLGLTLFTWSGLIVFIITSGMRVNNANAPVGYAERYLVLTISVWLLVVSVPLISF